MNLSSLPFAKPSARLVFLLALGSFAACDSDSETPTDTGEDGGIDGGGVDAGVDTSLCASAPEAWSAGQQLYEDRSAEWGLTDIDPRGTRVSVADLNGDGYPDLLLRRGGTRADGYGPDQTRSTWMLINTGDGSFVDETQASGLVSPRGNYGDENIGRPGEVTAMGDVDNDGDLDVYFGLMTWDNPDDDNDMSAITLSETSELMINGGGAQFGLTRSENALRRTTFEDVPAGASFTDFDLDGNLDLWLTQNNYQQDRLYQGDGATNFADITADAGLSTADWNLVDDLNTGNAHSNAWSATACDLNNDGYPELLAASYGRAPNHLWRANGDGTFANESVASGYAFDENQDWWDNQFARCWCDSNPEVAGCENAPSPQIGCGQLNWRAEFDREPFRNGGNSGATVCADLNNDGWMDLVTTEIKHWWAGEGSDESSILFNQQDPMVRFERPSRSETGMEVPHSSASWDEGHMSAAVLDVDNDGWQDIYIGASDYPGNRGLLYRQVEAERFEPVAVGDFFQHNRSHGVAVADFDRDGDLDILVGHSRSRCSQTNYPDSETACYDTAAFRLMENVWGDRNNWLQLTLEGGEGTNRSAIGARVVVTTEDGVTRTQQVGGGHGHYGAQNDLTLHFGLGESCTAEVTVHWPNGEQSTSTSTLGAGQRYAWTEGQEPTGLGQSTDL